jgi:hypothetical protein
MAVVVALLELEQSFADIGRFADYGCSHVERAHNFGCLLVF